MRARIAAGAGLACAIAAAAAICDLQPGAGALALADISPRAGDIILRQGTGFWGVVFARVNPRDRRFSHVGIVVEEEGRWRVVHAQADDLARAGMVREDDLEVFLAGVRRAALLRLDDEAAAGRVAHEALAMHEAKLAFDFDFDLEGVDAVYCSELAWRALTAGLERDPLPVKPYLNGREAILVESFLLDIPELHLVYALPSLSTEAAQVAPP